MVLRGRSGKRWSVTDQVLSVALTISESMRCPGCGQPKHEAYNPDSEGWYEIGSAECQGCAVVQRDAEGHKDHDHSRKVWVQDTRPRDVQLRSWSP